MFTIQTKDLGKYDVAVCGGGVAGVAAAVSAARNGANVILIERSGSLGGTLTEGFVPIILDRDNKGGIVRELFAFLDNHGMSCARKGDRVDAEGNRIPGPLVDTEGVKYFYDTLCAEAGVKVLYHSQLSALETKDERIVNALVTTECGNYSLQAAIYVDASGNGIVADMAGCDWDCGDPVEKRPSPASMGVCAGGFDPAYNGVNGEEEKTAYANTLLANGISVSAQQVTTVKLPSLLSWNMGMNFQYDVFPDDIHSLSQAVIDGRKEVFEVMEKHKKVPGYENLHLLFTSSHIGIREGRRIYGEYRLTDEDIIEGRRFEDSICLVTFKVDVHKLKADDTTDCSRGYRTNPYHIPYRCLVPKKCNNLLLAGRCISGDFYPHASYRVMGNMTATGEACGFAAATCVREGISPREFDGRRAKAFMTERGYTL